MNNDNQNYIGAAIQHHRHLKGLSQDQLARLSGVSYNTVVKLEKKGELIDPRISTLRKIAGVLEIQYEKLINKNEVKTPSVPNPLSPHELVSVPILKEQGF